MSRVGCITEETDEGAVVEIGFNLGKEGRSSGIGRSLGVGLLKGAIYI